MIICTEYQHLCISLSLWFSLLVVVGAIPRRGSWSTAGAGGRGWGLNVQQYYQVRSVLSGEIALAEGFFWTKVILTGFQVGEEEPLQQLPRGDLFPYIQQVNKPTHPQQIITTNTNELSRVPTPPWWCLKAEEMKLRSELNRLSITNNLEVLRERLGFYQFFFLFIFTQQHISP